MPQTLSTARSAAPVRSLSERLADHTHKLIVDTAVDLLENVEVPELTIRATAQAAGMSERTVYRYFATRERFLDAVAQEVRRRFELPPDPGTAEELLRYPALLFARFEARRALTQAALHSDLFSRMYNMQARERWQAVQRIVDTSAAARPAEQRRIAAANIRYVLSATTWNYYRNQFGFNLDDTIASVTAAIGATLASLADAAPSVACPAKPRARRRASRRP
jgi:AcrR family transcriptional regulator